MLERLFGSATRLKLLKTFLFQPEKRFTADDLVKIFKLKADSVRRELENLVQFGVVVEKVELLEDSLSVEEEEIIEEKMLDQRKSMRLNILA